MPPATFVATISLLLAISLPAAGTRMVPFLIPSVGDFPDAVNVGWLNHRPAGGHGFVQVKDGHFVLGNGERIRFLGGGLIRAACFPTHEQATALATRLANLGFNLVRVHHIDTSHAPYGFWDPAFKDKQHLDAGQLERFDFLVDALRKEGVYLNINLHVSRTFMEADGFPEAKRLPGMGKGVTIFLPRMIELQKNYARDLLTHLNPHTGKRYVDSPALAAVEINNENSLVGLVLSGKLPRLPDRYETVLTGHWNRWLAKQCRDSAAVNRRWSGVNEPPGEELLTNATFAKGSEHWTGESPDVMTMARVDGAADGKPALHIRCLKPGKLAWTMQMHQIGLELEDGKPYTFHFRMRSAKPAKVQTVARLDHAHPESGRFEVVGLNRPFQVGPEWQDYSFTFLARKPRGKGNRIGFTFPNEVGEFWLTDTSLKPGGRIGGITPGESLEAGTIRRPLGIAESTAAQWCDWIACAMDIESAYFAEMRRFLKEDLGVKCPIIGTQVSYGGIYGALREGAMDYGDMHAYWQHPRFLGRAWDMKNWRVDNTPMVDAPERSTLARLARHRLVGKPFVVSEYNHPAPSQYASECWPMAAAIGGVQDWDGIVVHNYLNYGPGEWTAGRKVGLFDAATNPQKTPFVFAAAILFRTGALAPAPAHCYRSYTQSLISEGLALGQLSIVDGWPQTGEDGLLMLNRKLSIRVAPLEDKAPGGMASQPKPSAPQVRWQHGKDRESRFTVDIPSVKAVTGQIAGKTVELGGTKITIQGSRTGYATVALVALDGKPISLSNRLLLSVGGAMANTGWKWNEEKTMLTDWGKSPTLTEVIPGQLTLKRTGDQKLRAFALDGAGRRLCELPMEPSNGERWTLTFGDTDTMWYEIVPR